MKIVKTAALLVILTLVLIGKSQAPVRASGGCEDACQTAYWACMGPAYDDYQTCMGNCEVNPWGGCEVHCWEVRQTTEAQCENDYTNCLTGCP